MSVEGGTLLEKNTKPQNVREKMKISEFKKKKEGGFREKA